MSSIGDIVYEEEFESVAVSPLPSERHTRRILKRLEEEELFSVYGKMMEMMEDKKIEEYEPVPVHI